MGILSYCSFSDNNPNPRVGAQFNGQIFDLSLMCRDMLVNSTWSKYFNTQHINTLIRDHKVVHPQLKQAIIELISNKKQHEYTIDPQKIKLHLPLAIGGFTDFYTSKNHATNVGKMFRPDNPLMPNWTKMPIAYNGRASSIQIDGHPVYRPLGQILVDGNPILSKSKKLDFEVEMAIVIGKDNNLGEQITIDNASEHIFGICILNDWSARDVQQWEYQPLGPFNSKSFLTSISPFVIPLSELEPFRSNLEIQEPKPLDYLCSNHLSSFDIKIDTFITTNKLKTPFKISTSNFNNAYWSIEQWVTQHTLSGCNLRIGDVIASGTLSGNTQDSLGCLLEMTLNGKTPLVLPNGERRGFLENGDTITMRGYCEQNGQLIDIGKVSGLICE